MTMPLPSCSSTTSTIVLKKYRFFKSMERDYGVIPNVKHCACIVDLLGRSGRLEEAEKFIKDSSFHDDPVMWRALLSSCRIHCDIERGRLVAERIMELEPNAYATYVILCNMYLDSGKRFMAIRTREIMKDRVKKEPGLSWIQIGYSVHSFAAGDKTHPQSLAIYDRLELMFSKIGKLGYARSAASDSDDFDLERKVNLFNYHSEKLAAALGIISLPKAVPIWVMKNLRVCVDCHTTMKLFSAVEGREIVLRNPIRFHGF